MQSLYVMPLAYVETIKSPNDTHTTRYKEWLTGALFQPNCPDVVFAPLSLLAILLRMPL